MVRALDKADAMLTLSSALQHREPFTILCVWCVNHIHYQSVCYL